MAGGGGAETADGLPGNAAGAEVYLSLVATARNDDHGGNLLGRMQAFVSGWLAQASRFQIPSELILVEWNPPADRPRLREALRWPDRGPCAVRIIEVPNELHRRFAHAEALPLYQMIAKNVGIRRARGRFIVATNIDILFSSELAAFFAERKLETRRMYRIDRHDAMSEVPVDRPISEQLAWCRSHLLRLNSREGTFPLTPDGQLALAKEDLVEPDAEDHSTPARPGVLFGLGWYAVERYSRQEPFRWAGPCAELVLDDAGARPAVLEMDLEPGPGSGGAPLQLDVTDESGAGIAKIQLATRSSLRLPLASPVPRRVLFHSRNGGQPAGVDPRVLNFRVFRVQYKRGATAASVQLQPVGFGARLKTLAGTVDHAAEKLFTGGERVNVTVPVSSRMRRALSGYLWMRGIQPEEVIDPDPIARLAIPPLFLHTNGCGDFTLMAREHWFDLRGYAEFDLFSMNIDSLLCVTAHHGGARETILEDPMRIYHIEHGTGSGWTPEGQAKLFERLAAKGIPHLENEEVLRWAAQMNRLSSPMVFNHDNWGMADAALNEAVL
jgi:hypothetical protein